MDCPRSSPEENARYLGELYRRMVLSRVPFDGSVELTRRCNLSCVHCYLGADAPGTRGELDTDQWREVIDQAVAAGCVDLLLTGGEPLLRGDFRVLYAHAREQGVLVTVFTNATLVSREVVEVFREMPPRLVEVSLYGATRETYERVTGVSGSHRRCLDGVSRLLDAGVRVGLKTMLLDLNSHELDDMRRIAQDFGVKFRLDAGVFPRLSGDRSPAAHRIPHQEAVAREMADPAALVSWRAYWARAKDDPVADTLYQCGAGHMAFHLDPAGNLFPCLMFAGPGFNVLTQGGFLKGWREEMPVLVGGKASGEVFRCHRCRIRALCAYCPGFSRLDVGDETAVSPYLCAMAHERETYLRGDVAPAVESPARSLGDAEPALPPARG